MSSREKTIYIVGICVWSVICVGFGVIWSDVPHVRFNNEIKIYEVLNIAITISIGISIPLLVKKWIDDYRPIKSMIIDEIKETLLSLKEINTIISDCHKSDEIKQSHKDQINYIFHKSELQIESLKEQITVSFKAQSSAIIKDLKESHNKYKDYLTDGELMLSSFNKVEVRFFREHNTEFSKIERYLKTLIHRIHKL
jgi:hypothetical protein